MAVSPTSVWRVLHESGILQRWNTKPPTQGASEEAGQLFKEISAKGRIAVTVGRKESILLRGEKIKASYLEKIFR